MAQTAVVIPTWNGAHLLEPCLRSLASQTREAHVIVVDNGSVDGTAELLSRGFPQAQLIRLASNRGFAGAVNVGIADALRAGFEFIALLNNDAVADPTWLECLLDCARQHPEAGIITSKFLLDDRVHIDSTGDFYSAWGWAYPRGRDEIDRGQYDAAEFREVFCGSGGASLFRARMLEEVGLFDEDYFAYLEDQDLGFRAQLLGWRARYAPEARAYHRMMGTSAALPNFGRYQAVRNCIFLYVKNVPSPLCWRYLPKFLLGLVLMGANDVRRRRFWAIAGAYRDALRALPTLLRKRREIQATRRVAVAYIDSIIVHELPPTQRTLVRIASLRLLPRRVRDARR
ncbi:MAG TPA: glycosyltransferase family 2 protein [Solirubrobacteraceae bacterium]|nr:glycosyltransferase family 2 protein [Solirubrobacteraceae bacterium]